VPARTADETGSDGELYTADNRLMLCATKAVAALDIELQGVTTDQVSLLLNRHDFQMIGRNTDGGSRYVIFSPTGQSIPAGEAAILRMSADGEPVAVECADPEAQPVILAIGQTPTGIDELTSEPSDEWTNGRKKLYDLQGHCVDGTTARKGIYIQNGRKVVR
jgi:hypothetical protein